MFYLVLFTIYAIAMYFAQKCYARSPMVFWVVAYVAVIFLSFFAGARDNSIGTDIGVYGYSTWHSIRYHLDSLIEANDSVYREFIYVLLNYVALQISDKFGMFLFLLQFAMLAFQLHALKRYMNEVPLWLSTLLLNLFFFNLNLNLLAQGLACSFLLWSLKFFEERRLKQLLLCAVVGTLMHKTAAVAYLAVLGVYIINGVSEEKRGRLVLIFGIVSALAVASFAAILTALAEANPVFEHFLAYGNGSMKAGISSIDLKIRSLFIIYTIVALWMGLIKKDIAMTALPFFIIDLCAQYLGAISYFTTRIGYFFMFYEIVLFLLLLSRSKISVGTKVIAQSCMILLFVYYCVRFNFVQGNNETYPYTSEFLGI